MVSFSLLRSVASRSRALLVNATQQQRRNMSLHGHHGPPPEWTGVDKVVRSYFPEDYQHYWRIFQKKPVEEKAPVVTADATESTGVPSIESSAFEKFVETVAFEKLLENESQLSKLVETA